MIEQLASIAQEAGALALARQVSGAYGVSAKGRLDFVTDIDKAVEDLIGQRIAAAFPDDGIVGEEGLARASRSGRTWFVDPIDGTHNFVRGGTDWAISVGAVGGDGRAAAIHAPALGQSLAARSGDGIWRDGARLPARRQAPGGHGIVHTGVSIGLSTAIDRWLTGFVRDDLDLADRRTGSAAISLLAVVIGAADLYIGFGEHIWDVAGGAILAEEAGCAHSLDWASALPEGAFTFVCGEPELVERTLEALQISSAGL